MVRLTFSQVEVECPLHSLLQDALPVAILTTGRLHEFASIFSGLDNEPCKVLYLHKSLQHSPIFELPLRSVRHVQNVPNKKSEIFFTHHKNNYIFFYPGSSDFLTDLHSFDNTEPSFVRHISQFFVGW